jgi:site-specific DNA recombinase
MLLLKEDEMKAYGYIRVSSADQVKGTSLDEQKRQIVAYAYLKGIELLGVLVDPAVKGEVPIHLRSQGRILVEAIDNGSINCVIITKLDRAFRSASDCLVCIEAWEKKNIGLHILNIGGQCIDTTTTTGKFFITVMAGAAELEKNLIKDRCNSGRQARKSEGKRIGEIPFGYNLAPDNKTLIPDLGEQRLISEVKSLKAQGLSLRAIARELNDRGIKGKKGGTWQSNQVKAILSRS